MSFVHLSPLHRRSGRIGLRALAVAWLLLTAASLASHAAAAVPWSGADHFAQRIAQAQDSPLPALDAERRFLAEAQRGADGERAFWSWLTQARIHVLLEQPTKAQQALAAARGELDALPGLAAAQRLAHRLQELQVATLTDDPQAALPHIEALTKEVRALGHPRLSCEADNLRTWFLLESGTLDEAFGSAQTAERCAQALGDAEMQAGAVLQQGVLARMAGAATDKEAGAALHFRRALEALAERPARYLRSVIEWELGKTISPRNAARGMQHLQRALALSDEVGDDIGIAVASVEIATLELKAGRAQEALRLARRARESYLRNHAQQRMAATYAISIEAMTRLRDGALRNEIAAARRWDLPVASPMHRAGVARAIAQALASMGEHRQAYAELERSIELDSQSRNEESNRSMRRLQAAYEAAQREAENARLRLRDESARLQLEAARAHQQTLWVALAALALVLAAAVMLTVRTWRQRREMAELALRDELTGAPNRRAILATANAQWAHCRRMGQPLGIALIDLDHFKRINDTHGHDSGDVALRAFFQAAALTLRAHDGIGRYGGEEWLLVVPGASADVLQSIFLRLRDRLATRPIEGLPTPHGLRFSMGAAIGSSAGDSIADLIAAADRRLYRAKSQGRDRLVSDDEADQPHDADKAGFVRPSTVAEAVA